MCSTTKKYFDLLCELRRSYKIEIVAEEKQYDPIIKHDVPTREASTAFLEFLRDELAIYPNGLIEKLHLDKIILCDKAAKIDQPISGCASMSLFPDSLPMRLLFRKNIIYLDVEYCNKVEGRISIHHELFHAIEAHERRWPKYTDPVWPNLNPSAFRYKKDRPGNKPDHNETHCDGFLSSYSMETVREDKAELYSHMIVNFARVKELGSRDKFLNAKIQRLKQQLKAFSEEFDESFWKKREQNSLREIASEYEELLLERLRSTPIERPH